ncbi:inorganic phosphate transporter family protein [Desulfovibrio sp. OttesenSCG-928-A18]|nr:inorganic phosphate transporter family protein [Desulfovibrio sp. OttesenSCG-928-A18]
MEILSVFNDLFAGDILTTLTVLSGLFFGWTIGSHYTGATLGMAYGAGIIKSSRVACLLVAVFVLLGATFESENVVATVGTGILDKSQMTDLGAMVMMLTAAGVTAANTWMRWPVSTSQLACFSVVGAGVAMGATVHWKTTVVILFATWVGTPVLSCLLGFIFTKIGDRILADMSERTRKLLGYALVGACCYAALTLGANNTGNAVGVFYGLGLTTPMKAGFLGGIVMGIGAMTWGKPILEKVGKGILDLDVTTGLSAKMAQSLTAHTSAMLGYPTSMNQALIGGVAGAGGARGLQTLNRKALLEIVFSWFFTPALAGFISFVLYRVLSAVLGIH